MNLLVDAIFTVDGQGCLSLPQVLFRLSARKPTEFSCLQAHQQHGWFAFLTQLASLALVRHDKDVGEYSSEQWESMLRALSGGNDDPWTLVVPDLENPAFMQPPVPEETIESWNRFRCPDEIDVLITTKNHDLKRARIVDPRSEHWVFSLITRQTMQGVYGRGHYGIARMNSGLGSRPMFACAPSERWSDRFLRDVGLWMDRRGELKDQYNLKNGFSLLWMLPWDGKNSLELKQLDPCFIEVCARIRMVSLSEIRGTTSATWRIASKEAKGNTGDIWTPVHAKTKAAVSVTKRGFGYEPLQEIWLSEEWTQPPAMRVRSGDTVLIARVLSRAQGKTEGFHQRVLPLAEVPDAQGRIDITRNFKLRVLKPAVLNLVQCGPDKLRFDDNRVDRWLDRFREEIDAVFFSALPDWESTVFEISRRLFEQAVRSDAPTGLRRYRAIVWAERSFYGATKHHFPSVALPSMRRQKDPETTRRHARILTIASSLHHQTSEKDLAKLRKLYDVESEAFKILMEKFAQPTGPSDWRWVMIFRSMARLVGLHRPGTSLGRALALLRLDELRVLGLLSASGVEFVRRLDQLVRHLGSRGMPVDQMELSDLILSQGQTWSDRVRCKIAHDFYGGQ